MQTGRKTILIVDDVLMNRTILHRIFSEQYDIEEAENGKIALSIMREKPISVILLDLMMPEMTGFEVMKEMEGNKALSNIPIIVITASDDEESLIGVLDAGAVDIITKPFNPRMVRARVKNVLSNIEGRRLAAESALLKQRIEQREEELRRARRDSLTGLYTREAFCEKARERISDSPEGSYIISCFDINNFKVINDRYGIELGNRVLIEIAEYIKAMAEAVGTFASRASADNYFVIFPADKEFAISDIADTIVEHFLKEGVRLTLQFSCGRYLVNDKQLEVGSMLDRALLAKATVKGRYDTNTAVFSEKMFETVIEEQWVVGEMEKAIDEKQFEAWFQAQYNHETGALIGAEALVRWRHPERGLISPGIFIPVFEKNGFVYQLDKCIWEQACMYIRKWLDEGKEPVPVSVNVSRYDIFRTDFVDTISSYIKKYNVPPELFRIEITESAFAKSTNAIVETTKQLQAMGLLIEIDDFGCGYSSFNTLKDVPADILKIDMRFLKGEENSEKGGNILESIVRMTRWLGMDVIAEGVETKEQADYLLSIGCSNIQGYLYAKPAPENEYISRMGKTVAISDKPVLNLVKGMNNDSFWNPSSIETLVFNRYSGGACVFEYYNGTAEILRMNLKYAKQFNYNSANKDYSKLNWFTLVSDEKRKEIEKILTEAVKSGESRSFDVELGSNTFDAKSSYLKITVCMIAECQDRHLFYAYIEDVTTQYLMEQQLKFLNSVSRVLLLSSSSDEAINGALYKIIEFFNGSRAYVFELDSEKKIADNTYEVCKNGVTAEIENLHNIAFETIHVWLDVFEKEHHVCIENIEKLDESRAEERSVLEMQGIKSLIAVPILKNEKIIGFVGVDDPTKNISHVDNLEAIGDFMSAALSRRDVDKK